MEVKHVYGEGDIQVEEPIPGFWDEQGLLDRSTSVPAVYNVVYHVIQLGNSSSENVSSNASSDTAVPLLGRDEALAQIEIAVLATIFALAVVGNVCVLVALGRRRKITSRMHMFILHLSIADLLVAFCNILPQLAWDISGVFRGGDVLCRIVTFLQVFVMYLSTYVLVMTAVDRYRAICYPLCNYSWTPRTVNVMVAGVYGVSAVLSIPQTLLFKYQVATDDGDYDCWANFDPPWLLKAYILSFTIIVYVIPFFVLVFTYGSICYTIWANQLVGGQQAEVATAAAPTTTTTTTTTGTTTSNGKSTTTTTTTTSSSNTTSKCSGQGLAASSSLSTSARSSPRRWNWSHVVQHSNGSLVGRNGVVRPRAHSVRGFSRAKLKTVKLTFVVIVAYLVCWSPFFISHIWWLFDPAQEANSAVVIMVLLSSLNSCCNPWIYLAFSGNLLRHLFPCVWPCCTSPPASHGAFLCNTPSHTPQRGIEMLVFRGRKKRGADSPAFGSPTLAARGRGLYGSDGGTLPQQRGLRQGSLTSLLTSRLTRNTSAGARRLSRQRSSPSPVPQAHSHNGDTVLSSDRNGLESLGSASDKSCSAANGFVAQKSQIPLDLILQAHDEDGAGSPIGRESSSGSNPRSPHLFKRTRLHERPAEEVAEAQLKWEHNMGLRGSSSS